MQLQRKLQGFLQSGADQYAGEAGSGVADGSISRGSPAVDDWRVGKQLTAEPERELQRDVVCRNDQVDSPALVFPADVVPQRQRRIFLGKVSGLQVFRAVVDRRIEARQEALPDRGIHHRVGRIALRAPMHREHGFERGRLGPDSRLYERERECREGDTEETPDSLQRHQNSRLAAS